MKFIELVIAEAYSSIFSLVTEDVELNLKTVGVTHGKTEAELASLINQVYCTDLSYSPVSVAEYAKDRKAALGGFIGSVIAGIQSGVNDVRSDYQQATDEQHLSPLEMIKNFNNEQQTNRRSLLPHSLRRQPHPSR